MPGRARDQQLGALLRRVGDAELELGLLVASRGARTHLRGGTGSRRRRGSQIRFVWAKLATGITPGMIGTSIPRRPRRVDEVEVDLVVEEELGDQEARRRTSTLVFR